MNNADFIKKYGRYEFNEMCKYLPQQLTYARMCKQIGGFKISNRKKVVKFYRKSGKSIYLEFATIFSIGNERLNDYLDKKERAISDEK